jgi:hypothetical protein
MSRPHWLATTVATVVLLTSLGCHGQKPTTTAAEEEEAAGPTVQAKATGAVAELSVVVRGVAPERYKRALERALIRSNLKVGDAKSDAFDLELVLEVSTDVQEEIEADADPDDPNTVGHEMAKYLARITVRSADGTTIDKIEANPDFELRLLSGSGAAIKTIRSKEQADVEFSGEGMNQLASKLVTSEAVSKFAAARPVAPAK